MDEKSLQIDFEPLGKRVDVPPGTTLLAAAHQAGIELTAVCAGKGTCGQCRVKVMAGACSPVQPSERRLVSEAELAAGIRLACQTVPLEAVKVHIPPDSLTTPQRLQMEGLAGPALAGTSFRVFDLELAEPSLADLRADDQRLVEAVDASSGQSTRMRRALLKDAPDLIRENGWKVRAVCRDGEIIGLLPPGVKPLGLAVDIGTTKVAAYLIDLESGGVLAKDSAMNPQIQAGEDVISRINYCMEHEDGLATLQSQIARTLNALVEQMCTALGFKPQQVLEAAVVGNTAMHHLFLGLPVRQLGLSPFVPAVSAPVAYPACELGLCLAPAAEVYLPANIAGYVGADHVAMLLATEAWRADDKVIALDIGTNTEISLIRGGQIWSCSCASGPAFEGAHIREGMRAAAGAVERVQIEGDAIRCLTIGEVPPIGICGSGILDAVAEMVRTGVLDKRGRLNPQAPHVRGSGKETEFVLIPAEETGNSRDLAIGRKDIYEILLAKAAIRAGIEILLKTAGIEADQIDRFIVAGAFGTYLDLRSAVQIGMFPDLPLERFSQVGNAAGAGARLLLSSDELRHQAAGFARRMQYVELTVHPAFNDVFMQALSFPVRN